MFLHLYSQFDDLTPKMCFWETVNLVYHKNPKNLDTGKFSVFILKFEKFDFPIG